MHEVEEMVAVVVEGDKERSVPWHGLGNQVENAMTAHDAMVLAGLDWEVALEPLFCRPTQKLELAAGDDGTPKKIWTPNETELEIPGQFAVVRDSDMSILGVVGSQYRVMQNSRCFEWFDTLIGSNDAHYETAGSLRGGRQIFLTARIPKEIEVGGVDKVLCYLALVTSHDGSRALTVAVTPVRMVCMNTVNYGLSRAKQAWSVKHTESAEGKIEEARRALGLSFKYLDEFQAEADRMIKTEITKAEFESIVKKLVPSNDEKSDAGRQTQMAMIGTLESSRTIDDSFRYTAWGGMNAIAEYLDWVAPRKSSKVKSDAEQRTEAAWFGPNKTLKTKAYELLATI